MIVHWAEAALVDLRAIKAQIGRHSAQYASGMVDRIFDRSAVLADHPLFGAVVSDYEDDAVRELFEDPYRILYPVTADRVDIVAVVHAARRLPRGL